MTIPAEIRKKHRLRKGIRVKFIETGEGILILPVVPLRDLYDADGDSKDSVYQMIRELQGERRREASEG